MPEQAPWTGSCVSRKKRAGNGEGRANPCAASTPFGAISELAGYELGLIDAPRGFLERFALSGVRMEPMGFEPTTFALRTRRSPN